MAVYTDNYSARWWVLWRAMWVTALQHGRETIWPDWERSLELSRSSQEEEERERYLKLFELQQGGGRRGEGAWPASLLRACWEHWGWGRGPRRSWSWKGRVRPVYERLRMPRHGISLDRSTVLLPNTNSCAQRKENRWFILKNPEVPNGFQGEVFNRQIMGWGIKGVWPSSD